MDNQYKIPHGLYEITTRRQKKNGTRQFFHTPTETHYISYANGYVRREIRMNYKLNNSDRKYAHRLQYQINPTIKQGNRTQRVMLMNEEDRIDLIKRRAEKYQGYGNYSFWSNNINREVSFY